MFSLREMSSNNLSEDIPRSFIHSDLAYLNITCRQRFVSPDLQGVPDILIYGLLPFHLAGSLYSHWLYLT